MDEARDVLIAHNLRCGERMLRKGWRLSAADVRELREHGISTVTGARLEPGDVAEDEAAELVAAVLAGSGIEVRPPRTGRCDLHATATGVLTIDRDTVDRINLLGGEVTVGTLAPWTVVRAGDAVATVKIIPYAVRRSVIDQCRNLAARATAIAVAPLFPQRVALIQTESATTRPSVLQGTLEVTRARIEALRSRLTMVLRCPHEVHALRGALCEAHAAGCDLVLVSGASVTQDRGDVVPAAIGAAGGEIEHFGMPVEPGNMLLLARLGDVPVINLPGCARSPHDNGLDWLLQRLLARLPVHARDIMLMGVGGLIRGGRKLARARGEAPSGAVRAGSRVAALILAAGRSTRMGVRNKLLMPVDGVPMVVRAANAAAASRVGSIVVVTGHEAPRIEAELGGRGLTFVRNPDYMLGMATSLSAGIRGLPVEVDAVLVLLGDMPYVTAEHLDRLIEAHLTEPQAICVPHHQGWRGNPVLWPRAYFEALAGQSGNVGGRQLLDDYAEQVRLVDVQSSAILDDIDRADALACAPTP
ncbi:molybdopterin-binding/glycosyltransferase family 2 protein [Aromatoleum toluclasticum]|uniref:NTP transferase domain-containing protein n=1 Tax=Aromatoleum toluclasticum TaxID=92003 RepID=UPI001D18B5F4|nr:molybdopterin-binding/glycosyltransferase family 2 protein [Aromatoleum toluclasticum]MCC4118471.1 molybdopterin-binding/glycosyltransferase family 2 protein [Aromatoleum toluclasticum]